MKARNVIVLGAGLLLAAAAYEPSLVRGAATEATTNATIISRESVLILITKLRPWSGVIG